MFLTPTTTPTATNSSSGAVPASTTLAAADSLQVPGHSGSYSADNFLGTTTPSDVSTANSPAMAPTTLAAPADSVVENFSLTDPASFAASSVTGNGPSASLLPSSDDEEEFTPRGNPTSQSARPTKPMPKPTAVKK